MQFTAKYSRRSALRALTGVGSAGLVCAMGLPALAQSDFPSRPIHFIIPFPPGSTAETSARFIGQKISELTGQPVVVEPRGGGNGFIAIQAMLSAPRDGHTLLFCGNSIVATNVALFKKLPYNPLTDLSPVSLVIRAPIVLLAPRDAPYRNLQEFIAAAKAEPGKLAVGSGSPGYQLMGALLAEKAGIELLHVPYKSAPDALKAAVGGEVQLCIGDVASALPLVTAERVRAIAVATERRLSGAPQIATAAEQGLRDFTPATWNCVVGPAGVPKSALEKLSNIFVQVMAMPDTVAFFAKQNLEILPSGQEPMRKFQIEEVERWKRIAVIAKIEPQ